MSLDQRVHMTVKSPATSSRNDAKLRDLLVDVLLIEDDQYREEYGPREIAAWDSLAMVSIATEVEARFGHPMDPEVLLGIRSIGDIKEFLASRGVDFDT